MLIFFTIALVNYINQYKSSHRSTFKKDDSLTEIIFKDTFKDVGIQELNKPLNVEFVIYNVGSDSLSIQKVEPDCHCTVASYSFKPVAPNDSAIIVLKYDAANLGPFQSAATVTTNSTSSPTLLFFRGFVKKEGVN